MFFHRPGAGRQEEPSAGGSCVEAGAVEGAGCRCDGDLPVDLPTDLPTNTCYVYTCMYICVTRIYTYIYIHICVCNSGFEHVLIFYIFGLVRPIDSGAPALGPCDTCEVGSPRHWKSGRSYLERGKDEKRDNHPSVPVFLWVSYGFNMVV